MAGSPIPGHLRSVTPALVCTPCSEAIDVYRRAFGAEEVGERMTGPDGPTQSPTTLGGSTAALFLYTDDVRAAWQRAIDAGAEEVFPLEMQFYGDLSGRVRDPFGHTWGLAQHVEDVSDDEMRRRMAAFDEPS